MVMMVLHAFSDGLVIGTSAASGRHEISAIVAMAMIAHKIPASFGLGSYLLALGWNARMVAKAIALFAAASPFAAFVCYGLQYLVPNSSSSVFISVLMLFSGGSVLYTACFHMLPEAFKVPCGASLASTNEHKDVLFIVTVGAMGATLFALIPHED